MKKNQHTVIIYPHPDDESFGSAGTILKMREAGTKVTYLCTTAGEMGRNMGSPPFANRESMRELREVELADACEILDCEFQLLGYRDKTLEFEDETKVARHLFDLLSDLKPTIVITYHPVYGVHPDHNATARATILALEMIDEAERPELWVRPVAHNYKELLGDPDHSYDVRDVFDIKMKAIAAHKSQADGILGDMLKKAERSEQVMQEALDILGIEDYYDWTFSN